MSELIKKRHEQFVKACKAGDVATVQQLLSPGIDVNDMSSETPLYTAAQNGHTAVMEILLKAGADVNKTPLYVAAKCGHIAVVEILVKAGADVNKTPLYAAAENGHTCVVDILLKAGADVNKTPLYIATKNGHTAVVEILVNTGADVNKQKTPLYIAAESGHTAMVEILVKAGADVNKKVQDGSTPLHIASAKDYHDVVAILLSNNADGTLKDKNGITAIDIMVMKYQEAIGQLFAKNSVLSTTEAKSQSMKIHTAAELKSILTENRISMAEERAISAERRAIIAEERATAAEEIASVSEKTAMNAEERAVTAEKRAVSAEESKTVSESRATFYEEKATSIEVRVASAEQRAHAAEGRAIAAEKRSSFIEKELSIIQQRLSDTLKQVTVTEARAITAEKRATIAEERVIAISKKANVEERRSIVAEARAVIAEKRASENDEVKKKASGADTNVFTYVERIKKSEDTVTVLHEGTHIYNVTEQQIQDLTFQCKLLQEQLDKANTPSWVVNKDDIILTDRVLGRGGWGLVKIARFCTLEVAAKLLHGAILSPHNQQLFKREMNIAALARHPNISLFIGATLDPECIILTELMHTSLRAVLEEKQMKKLTISHEQVSNIATDVGRALNYLHLMKPDAIIHRDVSSGNVLLEPLGDDKWKAKLSDFGSSNFARLVTTVAPGSATYAAPESADPLLQSSKMDVFSYGILLLEMSCNQFPEVQRREHLIQNLSWPSVKRIILECTARDPSHRPNIADVLIRLSNV